MSPTPTITMELDLLKIYEDCKSAGLTKDELFEVFSPLGLRKTKKSTFKKYFKLLLGIFSIAILVFFLASSFSTSGGSERVRGIRFHALAIVRIALIKLLPWWGWTEYYYSRCLVPNPFFEAPSQISSDDCNLCETLEGIPRVWNVSQSYVLDEFIRRERPFVVTDAMDDWQVMKTDQFWFDNVTEIYLRQENYRVCNVNTNLRIANGDFTRLLKRLYSSHTQQWFIHWENCQKEMAKAVRQYYRRPYFITNSLDFTGSNWVLMSSDFKGRVYKKIDPSETLLLMYQLRGSNHVRILPRSICSTQCPELTITLNEGEILVMTSILWIYEYIPGEIGDNLALLSEVSSPAME